LISPILEGEADLVIGSRHLHNGHDIPGYRRAGQKVLDAITSAGANQKVTDSQSGFRALSKKAMDNLDFESKGFNIESDMIVHFSQKGLRVKEVPIGINYDVPHKHTKNPLSHGIAVMGRVVKLVSQSRPLMIFGVPGFLLVLFGSIFGTASLLDVALFNWTWLFQTMVAILLFIIGLVFCISALVLNSISELLNKVTERVGPKESFVSKRGDGR
jgi:hypothetical protein